MRPGRLDRSASTLLLSLLCISALAVAAAITLQRISPRFQMASQAAAWQEARLSAEAGIDVGLSELEKNVIGFNEGNWSGWYQYSATQPPPTLDATLALAGPGSPPPPPPPPKGKKGPPNPPTPPDPPGAAEAAKAKGPAKKRGAPVPAPPQALDLAPTLPAIIGNPVQVSSPIFFDDLQMATAGNRPTSLDVQLWAVYPTPNPYQRWYRLRSIASVQLPPLAVKTYDRSEGEFRRFNLRSVRPQLVADQMSSHNAVIPAPSASRVIEVLVEPILPFELAILTDQSLSLATTGKWTVDSYDSRDANKSAAGGQYPAKDLGLVQSNASIGSNMMRPTNSPYGSLISANGAQVRGGVGTNGGDDPATALHENISGASSIDASRVRDDFYRKLNPLSPPHAAIIRPSPAADQPFVAGSPSQPNYYWVSTDLHGFSVEAPAAGRAGSIVIVVSGNLLVPSGTISIAPSVQAQVFVTGNVDFFNSSINLGGLPSQLQIYGQDSGSQTKTLSAYGDASISAAFYGPSYEVHLMDRVEWFGAIAARSFQMLGGGGGGFHYDEALALVGPPIGLRISRYVEDVRE